MFKKLIFLTSFFLVLVLVGNAAAQIDPATVATGHVYLLEDVNDGTVSDDSANENTGIIVGEPQLVDGINGKALQFDGIDDGVDIPDSEFINVTGGPFPNRTIIAVFNCADVTKPEKQTVFEEGGLTRGLTIYVFDGQVYVGGWNKAEYQWNPGSWLSAPINSNQWYTVSLVLRNGADAQEGDKFEMWLDGNFVGIAPGGQLYNHGNDNAIGYTNQNNVFHDGDGSGDGWYFEGMIDEVWILNEAVGTVPIAIAPAPANGEVDVKAAPVLTWIAPETTFQHDLYLGTDADLVAAGDASVSMGSLAEARFAVDVNTPLSRGTTYYWKVDVTTGTARASEFNPGNVWSFRVADENTANWLAAASADSPAYVDTFVENGPYDIGALGGELTYEFVVLGNPDEQEVSMALIGRHGHGDTTVALKYEQWNNLGTYGATVFGVMDYDYGVPNALGEYTHLTFVSSETSNTTALYVNGVPEGSIDSAITLSGIVGIGQAIQDPEGANFIDPFDGTIFGVAIYDGILTDEQIAAHADAYFNPAKEIVPVNPGTEGLVAYYPLENDVLDASGNGNDGTIVGDPVYADGPTGYGMAMEFDGDGDYVDCGNAEMFDITGEMTVACWIKVDLFDKNWQAIVTHGDSSWRIHRSSGSDNIAWGTSGASPADITGTTNVNDGEWHHIAGVFDGAQKFLYVDGAVDASAEFAGSINSSAVHSVNIGENNQATGRFFAGRIDEVMIYNRGLSELEVMYLAGKRVTPVDPGTANLLGLWNCDEGVDAVVGDSSGNGRDGAFVFGDPAWVEGVSGTAVELVGPTLIEIPPLAMELTEATMGGWILPYGVQTSWSSIIMHRGDGLAHGFNILDDFQLAYHWNDDSASWSYRGGDLIAEDDWTFAAVTVDAEKATFYVNGDMGSVNEIAHDPATWDNNIYLGGDGGDNWITRRMNGALDDVFMYDRALSAGEIRYLSGARAMDDILGPDVTGPGDVVQGVPNDGDWPGNEHPALAFDDVVRVGGASSKYLHFKGASMATGVQVEPASGPSVVVGITLTTANDDYGRDPIAFELSGSNDSIDGPYTLIAAGDIVDFAQEALWPRYTMNATPIMFDNNVSYKYYQITFQVGRANNDGLMQIAEIELRTSKY